MPASLMMITNFNNTKTLFGTPNAAGCGLKLVFDSAIDSCSVELRESSAKQYKNWENDHKNTFISKK